MAESLWVSASLELSEAASNRSRELAILLPALRGLLRHSGVDKSPYGCSLAHWVQTMQSELNLLPSAKLNNKSGWLRKQSRTGLSTKLRWVVLEGSRLMYYTSAPSGLQDSPLKGVLRLSSSTRITPTPSGFTIDAGPGLETLDAHSAAPVSPRVHSPNHLAPTPECATTASAPALKATDTDCVLNPLHLEKRRYVWLCDVDERDEWVAALRIAAALGSEETTCLRWSAYFSSASSSPLVYLERLAEFRKSLSGRSLNVLADWVRVYMAAGGRRSDPAAPTALCTSSASPKGSSFFARSQSAQPTLQYHVARLSAPSSSSTDTSTGDSGVHKLLHVATPPNGRVDRALHRTARKSAAAAEVAARAASKLHLQSEPGDSDPTIGATHATTQMQRFEAEATSSGFQRDLVHATLAATEASAQSRRVGHVPGDRVDQCQLDKDVVRDNVIIDGERISCSSTHAIVARLVDRVMAVIEQSITGASCSSVRSAGGDRPDGIASLHVTPLPWVSSVPRCASRLVTYCREVLLCTSRTVVGGDVFDALECIFRPPSGLFRMQQVVRGGEIELSVSLKDQSGSSSDSRVLATNRSCATPEMLLTELEISVACVVRYYLIDVAEESEAESSFGRISRSLAPAVEPDVPGHVATLVATYSKTFPWEATAHSGTVSLDVEWIRERLPGHCAGNSSHTIGILGIIR